MPADPTDRKAFMLEQFEAATEEPDEVPIEVEAPAEEPEKPEPAEKPDPDTEPRAGETPEEKAARLRDDKGRFQADEKAGRGKERASAKPKVEGATVADPKKPAAAAAEPVKAPGADLKAPQSWTAAAREAWKDVPPAARQEIHRLEGETRRVLQENAGLRRESGEAQQFRAQVQETLRPYETLARASGMNAMQYADSVLQAAAALSVGTPQQKAGMFAQLLVNYGADLDMVNAALQGHLPVGGPPPQRQPPGPQQQPVDVRAVVQEQFQALQQQALSAKADRDLEAFTANPPEFLNDVWEDMQLVLDNAAQRGRNLTYEQAYDAACKMNDEVQGIIQQRKAAEAATRGSAAAPTQRARTAAATVRSRPAQVGTEAADPTDRRAMLAKFAGKAS